MSICSTEKVDALCTIQNPGIVSDIHYKHVMIVILESHVRRVSSLRNTCDAMQF